MTVPAGRLVAFLRGINLGNRRITNDALQRHLEDAGLRDVAVYQASGNTIFEDPGRPESAVEAAIETHLEAALGYGVDTHVRTLGALGQLLDLDGVEAAEQEGFKPHVIFVKAPIDDDAAAALAALETDDDRFRVLGREVLWLRRGGMARAPISTGDLEAALGTDRQTMRTLGTVRRIVAKYR